MARKSNGLPTLNLQKVRVSETKFDVIKLPPHWQTYWAPSSDTLFVREK